MSRRARGYSPFGSSPEQDSLLDQIVSLAGEGTVGVFDLDGCLFDCRYRQVAIFHAFASCHGVQELFQVTVEHFIDWNMKRPMRMVGLSEQRIEEIFPLFQDYWFARFFSSTWTARDHAMPGARELVQTCYDRGMVIVYLTGRDDNMRAGTEEGLRIAGFPYDQERSWLITKPSFKMVDEDYKVQSLAKIRGLGTISVLIDNEPINVNLFQQHCPDALTVWIETDHSPRNHVSAQGIAKLRSFYRTDWFGSVFSEPI